MVEFLATGKRALTNEPRYDRC